MKKWMKALALTTALLVMSSNAVFAEEAPAEEPVQHEEVKQEAPKAEAPKAEAPKAEEPKAEAPAEAEAPKAEAEAPAEEAPVTIIEEEAAEPAADEVVEIDENETPLGVVEIEDSATPLGVDSAPTAPTPFRGSVKVERKGSGAIYFGDSITLEAKIENANTAYDIRWEVNRQDGAGWKTISGEDDKEYDFVVTEENAEYEYRVVLVTAA